MTASYLEHVNVTVKNPLETAQALCDIYGWKIRWQGSAIHDGFSVHVGSDDHYIALYNKADISAPKKDTYSTLSGLNHIAIVVDDLEAIEARVKALGYEPHSHGDYEPGKRFYYRDENEIEFEVANYQ